MYLGFAVGLIMMDLELLIIWSSVSNALGFNLCFHMSMGGGFLGSARIIDLEDENILRLGKVSLDFNGLAIVLG